MIMGMSKGNISRILCYETFMIGLVSLFTGLLAGFFLSQLLTVMTAHLFIIPLDNYRFIFSPASMLITVASFALIFLLVMIFNTISLNKYKCIDLLNADKKNEQVKIKSTLTILVLFILAFVLLIGDYLFVLNAGTAMFLALPQVVLAGCLGTLFFFMSLAGFLLRFIQSRKRIYFRKLNMFVLRQVNANINTNVISMSVICVLLLLGIGAFSTGLSLNQTINASIASSTPFDVTYESYSAEEVPFDEVAERLKLDTSGIENQFDIHNYGFYDEQKDESFTYLSLGNQIPENEEKNIQLYSPIDLPVYPLSDYNLFLQAKGLAPIELKDDQAFLFGSNETSQETVELVYKYIPAVSLKGNELTLVKKETPISSISNSTSVDGELGLVVTDRFIENNEPYFMHTLTNITLKDGVDSDAFQAAIFDAYAKNSTGDELTFTITSRAEIYANSLGLTVTFTYVGIYLGFVFLLASCVMLALQQLSQAADNRRYYQVLLKIGADDKMCSQSVNFQIAIYFLMPLSLAIVHSVVGILAMDSIVAIFGKTDRLVPSLLTSLIVLVVYGLYFAATCGGYKRILKQKN